MDKMPTQDYLDRRLDQMQDRFDEQMERMNTKLDSFFETQADMRVRFEQINQVHNNAEEIKETKKDILEIQKMVYRWSGGLFVGFTLLSLGLKFLV